MAKNIKIISKEKIKPSRPTADNKKVHKLSLLDQLAPPMYTSAVLFYAPSNVEQRDQKSTNDLFKTSLSNVLPNFYPLAGRYKDNFSIDCNDHGADYVLTNVDINMSEMLENPELREVVRLLPYHPRYKLADIREQPILGVQVNFFSCGGVAIGVCIWHNICDAGSLATFFTTWFDTARGLIPADGLITDCTSIFPPHEETDFTTDSFMEEDLISDIVSRRFIFNETKLAQLREKIGKQGTSNDRRIGRYEALCALMWSVLISIAKEKEQCRDTNKMFIAMNAVDVRTRVDPPLPTNSIGNIVHAAAAVWFLNKEADHRALADEIHKSIIMINGKYLKDVHSDGKLFEMVKRTTTTERSLDLIAGMFCFSSWCRFPFYEADFGWGKPLWVGAGMGFNNVALFTDTVGGRGIEARVCLRKETMDKFEQHPDILDYASSGPMVYMHME